MVQKGIDKCEGLLTPTTTTMFDQTKTDASKYIAKYNIAGKYHGSSTWQDQYVVNLNEQHCSCRFWEITGFPCRHVVCAIWYKFKNGENALRVDEWKTMYFNKIYPLNGMWPKSDFPFSLNPPKHKKQVRRGKEKDKEGC